jgi:hypothetical protein
MSMVENQEILLCLAPLPQQTNSWNLHPLTSMHEKERFASSPNAYYPFCDYWFLPALTG